MPPIESRIIAVLRPGWTMSSEHETPRRHIRPDTDFILFASCYQYNARIAAGRVTGCNRSGGVGVGCPPGSTCQLGSGGVISHALCCIETGFQYQCSSGAIPFPNQYNPIVCSNNPSILPFISFKKMQLLRESNVMLLIAVCPGGTSCQSTADGRAQVCCGAALVNNAGCPTGWVIDDRTEQV